MADVPETAIQRAQHARDLRGQIQGLEEEDRRENTIKEKSPRRRHPTLYAMKDGEPLPMPAYQAEKAISKIDPETGTFMFTAYPEKAPEYKLGNVLCFLHKDSADQPVLQEIGMGQLHCRKKTLSNLYSKRQHAKNRHPKEWEAYQDHLKTEKERLAEDRQQAQLDATLALAEKAGTVRGSDYLNMMESPQGQAVVQAKAEKVIQKVSPLKTCHACGGEITGELADHKCDA